MTSSQASRTIAVSERRERALTDADVEALADALEERMTKRLYLNIGRGVWGLAWKAVILGILALAGYGALNKTIS